MINWSNKGLKGTLPTEDLGMPFLEDLRLYSNRGLKGAMVSV